MTHTAARRHTFTLMKFCRWLSLPCLVLGGACWLAAGALAAAELPAFTPGKQTIQFTESALQSAADEVKSRLHSRHCRVLSVKLSLLLVTR